MEFCKDGTMMALRPMDIPLDRLRLQFEGSDEDGTACETAAPSRTAHAGQAAEERTHEAAEALEDDEWDEDEDAEGGLDWEVLREGASPATHVHSGLLLVVRPPSPYSELSKARTSAGERSPAYDSRRAQSTWSAGTAA